MLGFIYHHLGDSDVRAAMVELWTAEWDEMHDAGHPRNCYGKQLTDEGWGAYANAMPAALTNETDGWLKAQMSDPSFWMAKFPRRKPKGGVTMVNYNKLDALERLCFGEFNIAYIRGVATALRDRGETECVVYRADSAYLPRGECSEWEGQRFPVQMVLDGHRARYWPPDLADPSVFSVPTGPNCHHSIKAVGT